MSGFGTKREVWHGYALFTKNGLTRQDLYINENGRIAQKGGYARRARAAGRWFGRRKTGVGQVARKVKNAAVATGAAIGQTVVGTGRAAGRMGKNIGNTGIDAAEWVYKAKQKEYETNAIPRGTAGLGCAKGVRGPCPGHEFQKAITNVANEVALYPNCAECIIDYLPNYYKGGPTPELRQERMDKILTEQHSRHPLPPHYQLKYPNQMGEECDEGMHYVPEQGCVHSPPHLGPFPRPSASSHESGEQHGLFSHVHNPFPDSMGQPSASLNQPNIRGHGQGENL